MKDKTVNEGGINGLGESLINQNSTSFRKLREIITQKSTEESQASRTKNQ